MEARRVPVTRGAGVAHAALDRMIGLLKEGDLRDHQSAHRRRRAARTGYRAARTARAPRGGVLAHDLGDHGIGDERQRRSVGRTDQHARGKVARFGFGILRLGQSPRPIITFLLEVYEGASSLIRLCVLRHSSTVIALVHAAIPATEVTHCLASIFTFQQ